MLQETKQVVTNNRINSQKLWKIVNNIVITMRISCSKINGVFDKCADFVDGLKEFGNLMNKTAVYSIADKLIKDRKNGVSENIDKCSFD